MNSQSTCYMQIAAGYKKTRVKIGNSQSTCYMQIAAASAFCQFVVHELAVHMLYADCSSPLLCPVQDTASRSPHVICRLQRQNKQIGLNTRIECVLFEPYRVYLKLNEIQTDLYFLGLRTPSRPKECESLCYVVSVSDSHLVCSCFSMSFSMFRMPMFWLAL